MYLKEKNIIYYKMYKVFINLIFTYLVSGFSVSPAFIKEAEIKHGRVAMFSSVVIPILDNVKPDTLGVNFVSSLDPSVQWTMLGIVGCSEFAQMLKAYKFPSDNTKWFQLKEDHEPGNYSFDPLNLGEKVNDSTAKRGELDAGRVAMIAVACEMTNELLTKNTVF